MFFYTTLISLLFFFLHLYLLGYFFFSFFFFTFPTCFYFIFFSKSKNNFISKYAPNLDINICEIGFTLIMLFRLPCLGIIGTNHHWTDKRFIVLWGQRANGLCSHCHLKLWHLVCCFHHDVAQHSTCDQELYCGRVFCVAVEKKRVQSWISSLVSLLTI